MPKEFSVSTSVALSHSCNMTRKTPPDLKAIVPGPFVRKKFVTRFQEKQNEVNQLGFNSY